MKKQMIRYLATAICVLAAGICYSCSGRTNQVDLDSRISEADLRTERTDEEAGVQSGLISAETAAREESGEEPSDASSENSLPCQTESVRFYVHICGEVNNPGVYEMEPGSRIFQAVEMAGGLTEEAADQCLNMAQEIGDGMKITVPSREQLGQTGEAGAKEGTAGVPGEWIEFPGGSGKGSGGAAEGAGEEKKVNLNTASKEELMALRGIGEARAEDIIRYREEFGPFRTIEEIMNISGIKEAAFRKIKDSITV